MKTVLLVAFLSGCALAQSAGISEDVPRMLANRGVTSATTFADEYQKFRTAVAATFAASEALKTEILFAKRTQDPSHIAQLGKAVIKFSEVRFDLRYRHYRANEALNALIRELIAKCSDSPLFLLNEEFAIDGYIGGANEDMERDFAAADKRWRKTARQAEKILYSRRWRQRSND